MREILDEKFFDTHTTPIIIVTFSLCVPPVFFSEDVSHTRINKIIRAMHDDDGRKIFFFFTRIQNNRTINY
jgi:hypothetical protein